MIVALTAMPILALVCPQYLLFELGMVAVWTLAVVGVTVLTGYSGQISVASNAFMALGAYTAAILAADHGWPIWATLPLSAICGFTFGYVLGVPALRVRGFYLTTLTLAVAVVVPPLIKRFEHVTHGVQGILLPRPTPPVWLAEWFSLEIKPYQWRFLLIAAIVVITLALVHRILAGRIGRALLATKDAEVAAESNGINIVAYKTFAFALGSACTSVAGALYAYTVGLISPDAFSMFMSINLIAACVVGGVTFLSGALIGAVLLQYVPTWGAEIHQSLSGFAFGMVLIVFMLLMPRGILGLVSDYLRQRARRQPAARAGSGA